jgi:hypothetical protein
MSITINGTTGIAGVDGSAGTPALQGNDTNTGIFFPAADTIAFAEGGVEVARFDSSGNLGIGTSSPSYKLDVNGQYAIVGASGAEGAYLTRNASGVLQWKIGHSGSALHFLDFVAGAERMRIDASGNLLVGTTSVLAKQTIAHDGNTAFGLACANTAAGTAGQIAIRFMRNGADVGSITTTNTATAYNTSSDYRLKENVQPMQGALVRVTALKPCTYTWKADGSDGEGFIAHELAEVVPQCVTGEKDAVDSEGKPVYQGIDTSFLVATLTAAIQELKAELDAIKAEVAALKGQA